MLHLFPEQVLDNSLHTAILIGLVVTWLMFETFGWVFAGFVVAGYLAALAMVSPPSLVVVLIESVLCYAGVWTLALGFSKAGIWSQVFGRERFLLFVLLAIPMRLVVTGLAMPSVEGWLLAWGLPPERLGVGLFGVGIVLVPLAANTFWKLGLSRGLFQLAVTTTLTWILLAGVLGRFTNFGFGEFERTFDALAVSAWESSRSILVLICTVFVAARNNLRFGWDFGGILVPALLAMLVFTPEKIVATLAEIVILYVVYDRFLRLPIVRDLDLEGPRRIVTIFAVSYAWKWALALAVAALDLGFNVSDAYGFGYLLTSLVVGRARKSGGVIKTVVPILFTAAQGILIAIPFALALQIVPARWSDPGVPADGAPVDAAHHVPLLASRAPTDPREALPELAELDLGTEGPWILVVRPHGDPDTGWLAGWLASRRGVGGVLIAHADPSRHPTLGSLAAPVAVEAVRRARARLGARPLVVVIHGDGPPTLYARDPSHALAAGPWFELDAVVLATGALPLAAEPLWPHLGPQDAVLTLGPQVLPPVTRDAVSLEEALRAPPPGAPADPDLVPAVVVPALRRLAHDVAASGAWHHLAALVGAAIIEAEDAAGGRHHVLVRASEEGPGVDRFVFSASHSGLALIVDDAWRWPSLVAIAADAHVDLVAARTWIAAHPPATPGRWSSLGEARRAWVDRVSRAWLAPPLDWRLSGLPQPDGGLVLIEAAPAPAQAVIVGSGDEGTTLPDLPGLEAWLRPWPGALPAHEVPPSRAWQPGLAYAVAYAEAVYDRRVAVVWMPGAVLQEASGAADREGLALWLRAAGVPVREVDAEDKLPHGEGGGDAVAIPEVESRLAALADTPSDPALRALRSLVGWRVSITLTPLRAVWVAESDAVVCTRVALAGGAPALPWTGCRSRP